MAAENFGQKPRLLMAAICERAIVGSDNMLTIVRLIDVVTVSAVAPADEMAAAIASLGAPVQGTLVLVFKGGEVDATHQITVVAHTPTGDVHEFPKIDSVFGSLIPGAVPGSNAGVNLQMSIKREGTYWFEVKLDGETVTAVPLEIVFQAAEPPASLETTEAQ